MLYFGRHLCPLVHGHNILSQAHLWGKAQTIHLFIQLESMAEQIAGKSSELTLDHWSYNPDGEKKGLWHYQELYKERILELLGCAKGHYKNYGLLVLPVHTEIWVIRVSKSPVLCDFLSVSTNEKWLKGCSGGIWQASRNSLLIKPAPTIFQGLTWAVIQRYQTFGPMLWLQAESKTEKSGLVYIRPGLLLSRKAPIEQWLVGM